MELTSFMNDMQQSGPVDNFIDEIEKNQNVPKS